MAKPTRPKGFDDRVTKFFEKNAVKFRLSEYEMLDKGWLLDHFVGSIRSRNNSDYVTYLRHHESGVLIVACASTRMERLKRPQIYLRHLERNCGFTREKFSPKSPAREIKALAPFFHTGSPFIGTRPEYESFSGAFKLYYSCK